MASKTKNKGLHKDGSRSKEGLSSKKDGCGEDGSSPISMNGDLEDDQQLWIHAPEDSSNLEEKDRKRLSHNVLERRRKDKIKRWVVAIKELLPKFSLGMEKLSHGDIMEKACSYIKELQDKNEKLLQNCGGEVQAEEIEKLKKELSDVHAERDRLLEIIRNAGLSAMQDPSYQWKSRNQSKPDSTATSMDCEPSCSSVPSDTFVADISSSSSSSQKEDESKLAKNKRKNTVSFQLEQTKIQQQQLQEAAAAQAMAGAMFGPGFMGNGGMPLMNQMFSGLGQQVLANQNLLMNSGFANPGTVVMNGNGQMILPMSTAGTGAGVGNSVQPPGMIFQGDRNMAASGLGLLQLAMQDAGIGPAQSDNSRQPSPVGSTSSDVLNQTKPVSASSSGSDTPNSVSGSTDDINSASALQTLASVASNTQSAAVCSVMSGVPQAPASIVSQTSVGITNTSAVNTVMSIGQQPNYTQLMQQGNMVVNMPIMNPGQPSAPGMFQNGALGGYGMGNFVINQNGQMIVINEQGMPVMPSMQPNDQQQPQPTQQPLLPQSQQPVPTSKPAEKSKSSKKSKTSTSVSNSASVILPSAQEQTDTGAMNISLVSSKSEPIVNSANTITVTASQTQPSVMPPNLSQQQNPMTMFAQQNPMLQPQGIQPMTLQGQPQVSLPSGQNVYQQQLNGQLAMNQQVIQNPGLAMPVSQNGNLLTLNTMPSQPNQLPTALILPNGQIIPVVTNAQTVNQQAQSMNGNVQVLSNPGAPSFQYPPQMQPRPAVPSTVLGIDPNNPAAGTQMIIGPNGQIQQTPQQQLQQQQQLLQQQLQIQLQQQQQSLQQQNMGLLLTTTASSQVAQTPVYNCATLSTSVVPTSSTQSVMSTQVQASATASNVVQTANSLSNPQEVVSNTCSVMSGQEFESGSKSSSDTVKTLTSSVPPIAPAGVASTVTTPQGLVLNQSQNGPQAPVLLSVPMNGQQMNVLIDPVTMQVLATVAPNQNPATPATTAPPASTSTSTPPASAGKKSGKKNQRAIFPKPSSTTSKVTSTALPTETAAPPPLTSASPLQSAPASLPEGSMSQATMAVTSTTFSESKTNFSSTSTEASTTSVSAAEAAAAATDILAKAAESIFSPSPSEISPGPSFYNPANEDNPLHIDTSVGDGDEDNSTVSPVKATHDPQSTPSKDTEMAPPQVVVPPAQKPPEAPAVVPPAQPPVQSPLLPPPTPPAPEQVTSTPTKKGKSKSKSKTKSTTPETGKSESKKSSSKKKKQAAQQPTPPPPPPPAPPVNSEPEPKVVNLPDTIEFSVSQISDVLDQVESFGAPVEPVKKKSRKGKSDAESGEPANKKRKKNSAKEKEKVPVSQAQSNKALSVFDFDEDSPPEVSPTRRSLGPLHNQNSLPVSVTPPTRPAPPPAPLPAPAPAQTTNPPTPKAPVVLPPLTKEANTAAENFDLLDTVLSQALPLQTEPSTSQPTESVKSPPFTHSETNKNMEINDAQESCVQSFSGSVSSTPSNPMTDTTSNVSQTSSSSRLSHTDNQIFSKPSPITATSSDDSTQKTSGVSANLTPKSDLMENAVSSSILSPASAGSAQGQMSDMVVAAISSSGVDALAELTATPSASPSPGALIMESSPTYQPQIDQQLTPQQQPMPQPTPQQATSWQSPPPLQQSPSQSLQVQRPPSHPPQMAAPPPLQQQQPNPSSRPASQQQPAQIHPHNQPSNQSLPNQPSQRSKSANLPPQQQINYPSSQKSSTMQQSPSSTSMVSPPAPPRSRGGQESQSPFGNKGQGQVSSFQRSPCHEVPGSADQLFNSPPQVSSMPKLTHPPSSQTSKPMNATDNSANQRSRNSIYSADNFVQPSRNSGNAETRSQTSSANVNSSGNGFGRLPTDSTNESFNFTSIGLNLTSSTASNSLPEALTNSSNSATPFSFSLTPVTTTTTTTTTASSSSGPVPSHNHHQFSFYPLHPPVSQQTSLPPGGTATGSQGGQPNMLALGVDLRLEGPGPPARHPPNSNHQGQGSFNFHLMDINSRPSNVPPEPPRISMPEKNAHFSGSANGQKRQANVPPSRTIQGSQTLDHNIPTSQRSPHVNNSGSYYPPNFQTCTASLHTPPLHHHPAQSGESSRLAHPRGPYEPNFPSASQSMGSMAFVANRYEPVQGPFNRQCNPPQSFEHSSNPNSDSRKSANQSGSKGSKQPPQPTPPLSHPQSQPPSVISAAPQSHTPSNSHNSSCSSQPPPQSAHPMSQSVAQVRPQKSRKQSKKASKQQQQQQQQQSYNSEMDTNLAHSIFDSNQGLATYFQIPNLPPSPSRNMSNEGPSFLPGNLFGAGGRPISNSGPGMHKNAELGPPFNPLFPPSRAQNGLGLNFQHTFGMNPGNPSNGPQLGSHSGGVSLTPHMPNFSLGNLNFLSDVNSGGQNDSLNISPIKFPHGNTILPPQAGMDHNSLQHAHQGSSLYHQRSQPPQPHVIHNAMSINSILGHNPHGFDVRPMGQPINSSVTPPFHGAGHPGSFSMPPLNFSMHEH
ncbi:mucin-2-like [Haliotis asinina]|uniref:mucin-2-like n=1 Tax=Haliotis asinina TaxID=109174 RepID=UPI003531A75F